LRELIRADDCLPGKAWDRQARLSLIAMSVCLQAIQNAWLSRPSARRAAARIEQHLTAPGVPWTVIAPAPFMD
jgi:hypothetical protein